MTDFERIVEFTPAYDKRSVDPAKNYGVHGVDMRLVLKGPKGAVHFILHTNWHLLHVVRDWKGRAYRFEPTPANVGYHSPVPLNETQIEPTTAECEYLDGAPCYVAVSNLAADDAFAALVERGDDGIWGYLEDYYHQVFDEASDA